MKNPRHNETRYSTIVSFTNSTWNKNLSLYFFWKVQPKIPLRLWNEAVDPKLTFGAITNIISHPYTLH
jgi:hypothetical protein